jgi:hypothetical protein
LCKQRLAIQTSFSIHKNFGRNSLHFLFQTNGNNDDKRPRSPSPSSSISAKRISLSFNPSMASSPNVLHDRTNQMIASNDDRSSSKGVKRKSNTHRYTTLDFENDTDDFF